jgi:hypothetical protein
VPIEGVAAHLAVGDYFNPGADLQLDAFVHSPVFHLLENGVREFSGGELITGVL